LICGSNFRHETFALIINLLMNNWVPCHIMIGLFEITYTSRFVATT
jgi:hypothetical protein